MAGGSSRQWTEAQRRAIETIDCSVLVSAAAGSGKTSVLTERCVRLLCEGDDPCDVDQLLVVTFTEAAAAEMKGRITRALADRHAANPSPRLAQQMALADAAQVGTLHAFCARLLRQHFHLLGIDPAFVILDADEAALLQRDVAEELLGEEFDRPDGEPFRALVDAYGDGDDSRIAALVLRTHALLNSVVDPRGWAETSLAKLHEAAQKPLGESELGRRYLESVQRDLDAARAACAEAGQQVAAQGSFPPYVAYLRELWVLLNHWVKVLASAGIAALAEEAAVELKPLPRVNGKLPGCEQAKARVKAVQDEVKKGAWRQYLAFTPQQWADGLRQTAVHAATLLHLVQQFDERYRLAKEQAGALDFSDLERLALRVLRDEAHQGLAPSAVARGYRRQFRHVLVDEYQDINEVQDAILALLSREGDQVSSERRENGNLFCVGDVKQSIYRFRLAEPTRFLRRRERYAGSNGGGKLIDLQQNFRSREPLLEAINGIFERLMTAEAADLAYDQSQRLWPGAQFPDAEGDTCFAGAPIELHLIDSKAFESAEAEATDDESAEATDRTEREAILVANRVLELLGRGRTPPMQVADGGACRPIRFGDIAILLRTMQHKVEPFTQALRDAGVPVQSDSSTGYFQAVEVNDVLSLLAVLDNAQQDIPLAALLRSPLVMLAHAEDSLARIRLAFPDAAFHAAAAMYPQQHADELAATLRDFWKRIDSWRQLARQRPLAEVLWTIYDESGFLAYCAGLPNGEQRQANLIELHERAKQFGTFRRQGLPRFLQFLDRLRSERDLGQAALSSSAGDAVRVMSIHRSKGLEFPVVIVPDLGKTINFSDSSGSVLIDRQEGIGLQVVDEQRRVKYPSLAWVVVRQRLRQQTVAEELRVLYVAMTRAKEHLVLLGSRPKAGEKVQEWSGRWGAHSGPLPPSLVLGGRCMLDGLGPAAAAAGERAVCVQTHEVIAPLQPAEKAESQRQSRLSQLAQLQVLQPDPPVPPAAQRVMDELCREYPFAASTREAAAVSVTSLAKRGAPPSDENQQQRAEEDVLDRLLPPPSWLAPQKPLQGAERGNATHAVLQWINFSRSNDRSAVEQQIQQMMQRRRITPAQAAAVDVDAILWLMGSEIGQVLRDSGDRLLREVPVYFTDASGSAVGDTSPASDAHDQVMVRGRLDMLAPVADDWMIIDYKTDAVRGAALEQRALAYAAQLQSYRGAIARLTEKPVRRAVLIFLDARQIREV